MFLMFIILSSQSWRSTGVFVLLFFNMLSIDKDIWSSIPVQWQRSTPLLVGTSYIPRVASLGKNQPAPYCTPRFSVCPIVYQSSFIAKGFHRLLISNIISIVFTFATIALSKTLRTKPSNSAGSTPVAKALGTAESHIYANQLAQMFPFHTITFFPVSLLLAFHETIERNTLLCCFMDPAAKHQISIWKSDICSIYLQLVS